MKNSTKEMLRNFQMEQSARLEMPELTLWRACIKDAVESAKALSVGKLPANIGGQYSRHRKNNVQHIEDLRQELEAWATGSYPLSLGWICGIMFDLTKTQMDEHRIRLLILDCVAKSRKNTYGKKRPKVYSLATRNAGDE